VLLLCRPPDRSEEPTLGSLLREHPARQIADLWAIDLRRRDPGIEVLSLEPRPRPETPRSRFHVPLGFRLTPRRDAWRELAASLANGVVATGSRRPAATLAEAGTRQRLLDLHNYQSLVGDPTRATTRARILEGHAAPLAFQDPAPFGLIAGARWDAGASALLVVWECAGIPPRVDDFGLRLSARPLGRGRRGFTVDVRPPAACRNARPGELREEALHVAVPAPGAYALTAEATRQRGKMRRPTGHLLDLPPIGM
jgi:hypothetical protein